MWSLETLDYLNRQAAQKARRRKREPYVPALDEIDDGGVSDVDALEGQLVAGLCSGRGQVGQVAR